jgi:hypothetical protein
MFFKIFNLCKLNKKSNEKLECFICYEPEIPPIKLNNQKYYNKSCQCDGIVHKTCLDEWYNKTSKCPICRKPTMSVNIPFLYKFFIVIRLNNIYIKFSKFMFVILFMVYFYHTVDFYISILFINKFNYDYNSDYYKNLNTYNLSIYSKDINQICPVIYYNVSIIHPNYYD